MFLVEGLGVSGGPLSIPWNECEIFIFSVSGRFVKRSITSDVVMILHEFSEVCIFRIHEVKAIFAAKVIVTSSTRRNDVGGDEAAGRQAGRQGER